MREIIHVLDTYNSLKFSLSLGRRSKRLMGFNRDFSDRAHAVHGICERTIKFSNMSRYKRSNSAYAIKLDIHAVGSG
jgi:hypothetical protein